MNDYILLRKTFILDKGIDEKILEPITHIWSKNSLNYNIQKTNKTFDHIKI